MRASPGGVRRQCWCWSSFFVKRFALTGGVMSTTTASHVADPAQLSVLPGTLTIMTTTDVLTVRSAGAGGFASLGLSGWLGTMSPHTARAYAGDLRQFTGWLATRNIDPSG